MFFERDVIHVSINNSAADTNTQVPYNSTHMGVYKHKVLFMPV